MQTNSTERSRKKTRIRITLVDDSEFTLECLGKLLRLEPAQYKIVGEFRTAEAAIAGSPSAGADIILLDINLPGKSGLEAVPELRSASPATRILLCTAYATDERILAALSSGAHGFLEKTAHWSDLVEAIRRVAGGEYYLCPRATAALAYYSQHRQKDSAAVHLNSLTEREREVVRLVSQGKASKQIAAELSISTGTVDVHRSHAMKKLGVSNIAALIASVLGSGLLE